MKYFLRFTFIVVCLISLSGCGAIAIASLATMNSTQGDRIVIIEKVRNLRPYESISLTQVTGEFSEQLTPELLTYMNKTMNDTLSENGANLVAEGNLKLSGQILHITDRFRDRQIIVRIKLKDGNTDRSLGVVNITGEAGGLYGIESAADSVADELLVLLANYRFSGVKKSS
jgi:hypothetical protein